MSERGETSAQRGYLFERKVAAMFRALGAEVTHNAALAGNQIDIITREITPSGTPVITVVECKAYSRPVGVEIINSFAGLTHLLKQRGLTDRSILVATSGFTTYAREAAEAHGIDLLEFADLEQRVQGKHEAVKAASQEIDRAETQAESAPRPRRLFAAMPFSREFDDVYLLGVREVAEQLDYIVERADEVEHNDYIVDVIRDRIAGSDAVIADTTSRNPNVCYEVGFAHGIERPTILICRDGEDLPFDLQSVNHIRYGSIVDLRERLRRRLRTLFAHGAEQ